MPKGDKLKAAFLGLTDGGRQKLAVAVGQRVTQVDTDASAIEAEANKLPPVHPNRATLMNAAAQLRIDAGIQSSLPPVEAYPAMGKLCSSAAEVKQYAVELVKLNLDRLQKADGPFGQTMELIGETLEAARTARTLVANQKQANDLAGQLTQHEKDLAALAQEAHGEGVALAKQREADELLARAADTLKLAKRAQAAAPIAGTPRAESHATLGAVSAIPELKDFFDQNRGDPRGRRNALQESAARLEVFDDRFALPEKFGDKAARNTNQAMRLACVAKSLAMQQSRSVNDPALEGRLGQLAVREYEPELRRSLEVDNAIPPEDATAILKMTQAIAMDDPVGKLLTGKIRFEDAAQRVRDQAIIAGVKPSEMLKMLRQQFEMRLGSLTMTNIGDTELGRDKKDGSHDEHPFVLDDLEGELNQRDIRTLTEFDKRDVYTHTQTTTPSFDKDGLAYKTGALDQLVTQISAWDTPEIPRLDLVALRKPAVASKEDEEAPSERPDLSGLADALKLQAAKLKPTGERTSVNVLKRDVDGKPVEDGDGAWETGTKPLKAPAYIPAPGLGQDHAMTGPLGESGETDAEANYGALNPQQYAHLRMLQRADEEDRARKVDTPKGPKTPEEIVKAFFAEHYALDGSKVDDLLVKVGQAFATVPLTVTFTASSVFKDDMDAPAHGTAYTSDVLYTRGQSSAEDLIGRSENTGTDTFDPEISEEMIKQAQEVLETKQEALVQAGTDLEEARRKLDTPPATIQLLEQTIAALNKEIGDLERMLEGSTPMVGVTGGAGGSWEQDRGKNYQRWRKEKDRREGRLDESLGPQDAQIFGAVNPSFAKTQGTSEEFIRTKEAGRNYYGDAHFLLGDAVRQRAAYCVRGSSISVGGGKSAVQRTDLMMMLYDMVKGANSNLKYIDSIALLGTGSGEVMATQTDWEIHIYGGFDMTRDAEAIYLSSKVVDPFRTRIVNFASKNGISVLSVPPGGIETLGWGEPVRKEIAANL
jgi:hypothetical protein